MLAGVQYRPLEGGWFTSSGARFIPRRLRRKYIHGLLRFHGITDDSDSDFSEVSDSPEDDESGEENEVGGNSEEGQMEE